MKKLDRTPKRENPVLFDRLISDIQDGLADGISWLDHIFPRAERLVKMINGKRYYSANIYLDGNDYELIEPDSNLGNFAFFYLDDAQGVNHVAGDTFRLKCSFSLIVWVDIRKINETRDTEAAKQEVLRVLTDGIRLKSGRFNITKIYERAETVFKDFTLSELDNQFFMHPFYGWRFCGEMTVKDTCYQQPKPIHIGMLTLISANMNELAGNVVKEFDAESITLQGENVTYNNGIITITK